MVPTCFKTGFIEIVCLLKVHTYIHEEIHITSLNSTPSINVSLEANHRTSKVPKRAKAVHRDAPSYCGIPDLLQREHEIDTIRHPNDEHATHKNRKYFTTLHRGLRDILQREAHETEEQSTQCVDTKDVLKGYFFSTSKKD